MITVQKIDTAENPEYETADWDEYTPGEDNGDVSLPVEYEVKGEKLMPIEEGGCIFLDRTERNGESVAGAFKSSKINKIEGNIVTTQNSVYQIDEHI